MRAYAKINSLGQWIDRSEHLDLNALFARMTSFELEEYAKDGTLPEWFCEGIREPEGAAVSITASDSDEDIQAMSNQPDKPSIPRDRPNALARRLPGRLTGVESCRGAPC